MTTYDICGTAKGYRRHVHRHEPRCQPCKDAYNQHLKDRVGVEPAMTTAELIHEIERLLSYGEGWGTILKASGLADDTFKQRMRRAGRHDLNEKVFNMEGCVAA